MTAHRGSHAAVAGDQLLDHPTVPARRDPTDAEPAPFVILAVLPDGALIVPALSARAAQIVARQLAEHYPQTQARWQPNPDLAPEPVAVFGCARPEAGDHVLDQQVHAFLLVPGQPIPSVWVALCGLQIDDALFEAVDQGAGRPCPRCHEQWTTYHRQRDSRVDPSRLADGGEEPVGHHRRGLLVRSAPGGDGGMGSRMTTCCRDRAINVCGAHRTVHPRDEED